MVELKVRAKHLGEWVEGYFCVYRGIPQILVDESSWETIDDIKTVGRYTGLCDKNGKKIFEGDIVSTKYELGRGSYYVFEVYYNENLCQFALTINSGSYTKNKQYDWLQLTSLKANKVEVIGNIHDNKELLNENLKTIKTT